MFRVKTQRPNVSTDMLIVNLSEQPQIIVDELKKNFTNFEYYIKNKYFKNYAKEIEKVEDINTYFKELDKKYSNRMLKSSNFTCEFVFSVLGDVIKRSSDDESLQELANWFNKVNQFVLERLLTEQENIFMEYVYSVLHLDENHPHTHILFPAVLKNGNHFRLNSSTYQVYLDYKNLLKNNNWYVEYAAPKRRRASLGEYQKALRLGFSEKEIDMFLRLERMFIMDLNYKNIYKHYFEKVIPVIPSVQNSDQVLIDLIKFLVLRSSIQWNELNEFKQKYKNAYDILISYLDKKNYVLEESMNMGGNKSNEKVMKNPMLESIEHTEDIEKKSSSIYNKNE